MNLEPRKNRSNRKLNNLEYLPTNRKKRNEHDKYQIWKLWANVGKVCGIGERIIKENWKERIWIFNVLVKSVALYGVETCG